MREVSADWLAANHWFVPYEEIAQTEVTREIPLKAEVRLHGGRTLAIQERMSSEFLTKDSRETVIGILHEVG